MQVPRRDWLKASVGLGLGAALTLGRSVLASANERIEIGVIGLGVRGKHLIANLPDEFRVTALCDCAGRRIESVLQPQADFADLLGGFAAKSAKDCRVFQDYREMLTTMKLDAVIIATPDHHHASAAVAAMREGCHVYVEKPLATTIAEGRAIVNASRKYQRVVQVGSQQRSMKINQIACEFIRSGGLGRVHLIEERNLPGPMPYEPALYPEESLPNDLDWNLFCGPTPMRVYHPRLWIKEEFQVKKLLWRGWDLFEDYSGHLTTNWGGHSFDMVQYALGMDESGPVLIEPSDRVEDDIDVEWKKKTPPLGTGRDEIRDRSRFAEVSITYRNGTKVRLKNGIAKMAFYGEKGKMIVTRNHYECDPVDLLPPMDPDEKAAWDGEGHIARPHLQNWADAIRTGKALNAPVEIGHRTATVCHLINISRRLGERLQWNPEHEKFVDNPRANDLLSRPRRAGFGIG